MENAKNNLLNEYLKKRFGCKVYKVALNGGFSCPNRDGKISRGGCLFCSEGGSGEFGGNVKKSITEQLKEGKEFISSKLPKGEVKYIAYFQSFSNTYSDTEDLRRKYTEAISDKDVCVLSIATRPDCLGDDVLLLLKEMNVIKPVWVELGLQTVNEDTAKYINRGYELPVYDEAVKKLKAIGIEVITHVILGLPGETREDMLKTVKHVCDVGSDGIKLQLLHVLKNTGLYREYELNKFKTLEVDEYIDILKDCIAIMPESMIIHRLTGDGDKKLLVAPLWSADKKRVLNTIKKRLDL